MMIILGIVLIICSYILIRNLFYYKQQNKSTEKLIDEVIEVDDNEKEEQDIVIDWTKLENINSNIIRMDKNK